MYKIVPLVVFVVAIGALTGCAAGALPGGSSASAGSGGPATPSGAHAGGSGSGAAATSASECSVAQAALKKVVTAALSAPVSIAGGGCRFGIGPSAGMSADDLKQQYADVIDVQFHTSGVDDDWTGANIAYSDSGVHALSGVGTQAKYWGGLNDEATPQVWARTSGAFCLVQSHINSASEVGLTSPGGAAVVAKADMPKLAAQLGGVCRALFG